MEASISPPRLVAGAAGTALILFPRAESLPAVWVGPLPAAGLDPGDVAALLSGLRPCPLLPEHGDGWFGRPGLSGHRLGDGGGPVAGLDWSPLLRPTRLEHGDAWARIEAADAGLRLVTEVEAVPGGAIRTRHTLTNAAGRPYVVDSLEVVFPLPARVGEVLDFTGRPTAERIPQRHRLGDGLWLREGRRGHTGHDSPAVLVAGVPGFTFGGGEVYGLHVAWSGNTVHRVERVPSGPDMAAGAVGPRERIRPGVTTIGGGELLLLPGEIVLAEGESYATPWVYLAATACGLDGLAAQFHGYLRSRPVHPDSARPVTLNIWEAVYFDHDFGRLAALADLAAGIGVERYALARQRIQRWTGQLVPPEYLGAHVSAPFSHQTGRYMPLSLRCATALFGHFGVEWDITAAGPGELAELAGWIGLYKRHRSLIGSGRVVRLDTPDDTAWMHGVVASDGSAALMSYVQLDEPVSDQPAALRVPGLDPRRRYQVRDVTPGERPSRRVGLADGVQASGAALAGIGLAIAPQRTLTAVVILVEAQ